ncbi:MAG: DUF928 domain-containing protein [Elainellaceae cyanobacterium]
MPPNRVRPGGGLDPALQSCARSDTPLTALVPVNNPVHTVESHPSFLFYFPDSAHDVHYGEFVILTADEKERIYSTRVAPPESSGIVTIEMPELAHAALEMGQRYHWYFKVYCASGSDQPELSDLSVDGWIRRVRLNAEREQQLATFSPELWYDSLARAAIALQDSSGNTAEARTTWRNLLEAIDLESLANAPFVDVTPASGTETAIIE